ncbi:MAG TPA: 3-deoxy-D-manno-octulosonic acid transferase [Sulfuricurvum sp.]|nr:3-deoxy-D-manno-octulosonic acid transferase [Sulfuricurvum sp.]
MPTKSISETYFIPLFITGLLIGLFFSFLYAQHQILTGDQIQMLTKGYMGAHQGIWQSYGNAASAVGNVPGSLSAYIVGLPLLIIDSPWAPMSFLIFLHLISFLLFDAIIKQMFTSTIRLAFMLLYWLNPWFLFENILYNPSYLFFFSALHFWTAFQMREKRSFIYSFLHLLSIGMAMQLHYSWIILAFISSFLWYKKMIQIHWPALFLSAAVILASLIPYFQEFITNPEIRQNPGNKEGERYIGWGGVHVYPVLKAITYWFRYATFFFSHKLVLNTHFEWLPVIPLIQTVLHYLYLTIVYGMGIVSLWIAWVAHRYSWNQIRINLHLRRETDSLTFQQWILLYSTGAFIAVLISAILSPIVFSYWHLIIVFAFTLLPIVIYLNHYLSVNRKKVEIYLVVSTLFVILVNLVASHESEKFSYHHTLIDTVAAAGYTR